jgi:hypothetical protein
METKGNTMRQATNNEPLDRITIPQGVGEEEVQ